MYKIDRRGGGPKNRSLGNYQILYIFSLKIPEEINTTTTLQPIIGSKLFKNRLS